MDINDVISLTRELISFNTVNPPGNEATVAEFIGKLLAGNGFDIKYISFEENRMHLIAEKGLTEYQAPVVLSGHLDTVPLGVKQWSVDPFAGLIKEGKIFGRGSSDMKAGLAAMICAALQAFNESTPPGGVRLIITAGEELGCQGIQQLAKSYKNWGKASAILIGEPTANIPAIGHKGALYLKAVSSGKTAHSSMPELGDNAIYKAARSISKIAAFSFNTEKDFLLGYPTINVGRMSGGMNINSVPDHAEFTIDVRSTSKVDHDDIRERLSKEVGTDATIETLVDLKPVYTNENEPFVKLVYDICEPNGMEKNWPRSLPYVTDGSVLQSLYQHVPTIILGPGQPEMAHQTDEFCYLGKIEEAVNIYKSIILTWRK